MFQDVINSVKKYPQCQTVKGDYTDPKTKLGTIIANNPRDLLCINFTKVDPSESGKEKHLSSDTCLYEIKSGVCNTKSEGTYHSKNIGGQVVLHIWYSRMNS